MPTTSPAQHRLMEAAAHTKGGYGGVPQSVGKEFVGKDCGMNDYVAKLDAARRAVESLGTRVDARCDDWSDEARKAAAEARKKGAGGSSEDKKMPKLKTGSGGLTRDANYQTLIEAGYSRDEAVKLSNQHANQSYDNRKAAEERRKRRNG